MRKIALLFMFLALHASAGINLSDQNIDVDYDYCYESDVTQDYLTLDVVTIYHPVMEQCDSTPLITASNKFIDTIKLKNQKIRWVALSRDLLSHWGGSISYGDTIIIESNDNAINGEWVVNDTMNKKYTNRADLLFHGSVRKMGLWKDVKVYKKSNYVAHLVPRKYYYRKLAYKKLIA